MGSIKNAEKMRWGLVSRGFFREEWLIAALPLFRFLYLKLIPCRIRIVVLAT